MPAKSKTVDETKAGAADEAANEQAALRDVSLLNVDWSTSISKASGAACAEVFGDALEFISRSFQNQADHIRRLTKCEGIADAMKCNSEYLQKNWQESVEESSRLMVKMREDYIAAFTTR